MAKGISNVRLRYRLKSGLVTGTVRSTRESNMKWLLSLTLLLAMGCASHVKEQIGEIAARHDAALIAADEKLKKADATLASIPTSPQIESARTSVNGARADIGVAQSAASELKTLALGAEDEREKLASSFWSTKQKQLAIGVGSVLALVGLAIVLMRYGGLWGGLVAVPVLGIILKKLGAFRS